MSLTFVASRIPLATDGEGQIRIAGTRVTLDTILCAFRQGAGAEEIAQQYPSLSLADVYTVIGYYLKHREEIDEYLGKRNENARKIRRENESRFDPQGIRERLLARRERKG